MKTIPWGLLPDWMPLPWHRRPGFRLSLFILPQICLLLLALFLANVVGTNNDGLEAGTNASLLNWEPCRSLSCPGSIANMLRETKNGDKSGNLTICYPSAFANKISMAKANRRFAIAPSNNSTICNACIEEGKCSNQNESVWHGLELSWIHGEAAKLELCATIFNNRKMDVTTIVHSQFGGNFVEFVKSLLEEKCGKNVKGAIEGGEQSPFEEGAFVEDYVGLGHPNELDILRLDLAVSPLIVNRFGGGKKHEGMKLWIQGANGSIDEEARLAACKERVDELNRKAGCVRYEVNERLCLLDDEQRKNLYGNIPEPPKADGQNQSWGGDATGPLEYPEPETIEEEMKRMKVVGRIKLKDLCLPNRASTTRPPAHHRHSKKSFSRDRPEIPVFCNFWSYDLREKWPQCKEIISNIRDQGDDCASCWAVSTASALTDRSCIFIAKKRPNGTIPYDPERFVSARDAMECAYGDGHVQGCSAGSHNVVWKYYVESGTVNERCKPYINNGARKDWKEKCHRRCDRSGHDQGSLDILAFQNDLDRKDFGASELSEKDWIAAKRDSALLYLPTEYRHLSGGEAGSNEEMMKREIETNGSIVASMEIYDDFATAKSGGIYKHDRDAKHEGAQAVRIIGYGVRSCGKRGDEKFWIVADSLGSIYYDRLNGKYDGTFWIARGENECGIETSSISWGTLSTFPYSEGHEGKN